VCYVGTGGPWLPEEIRIHLPDTTSTTTTAATTATATAKGLSVSERADPPLDIRGGNRGESLWYTAGAGAEQHKPPGGVRYKVSSTLTVSATCVKYVAGTCDSCSVRRKRSCCC
jgi:hypothetical protein